jgi:hypothetical protein
MGQAGQTHHHQAATTHTRIAERVGRAPVGGRQLHRPHHRNTQSGADSLDSSTVIFKVNDLFNGKKNVLNDVFNQINIGTSHPTTSRDYYREAFDNSVIATSELNFRGA